MAKYKNTNIGKSCSLQSFANTTGLKIDEMHLAIETSMRVTDKYLILENIDQMIEQARNVQNATLQLVYGPPIDKEDAEMKLDDLRRWFITQFCYDVMENCDKVMELRRALAEKDGEIKRHQEDMRKMKQEWETEKEQMAEEREAMNKKDEWAKRVTFEAVVEQIAACEDAKERDEARKLIEPLLKRDMVARFRREIRNKVKELSEGNATSISIGKVEGDFNVTKAVKQIGN